MTWRSSTDGEKEKQEVGDYSDRWSNSEPVRFGCDRRGTSGSREELKKSKYEVVET